MPRINPADMEKYVPDSGAMFSLKDDGDTARVRVLWDTIDDCCCDVVHRVQVNGVYRYVNCLRQYGDPVETCPLCASNDDAHKKIMTKIFVPLYNVDKEEIQTWDRGKQFYKNISQIIAEQPQPFVGTICEIVRHGKAGDFETTYEITPIDHDDTMLEDIGLPNEPLGTLILDKTFEELERFENTGSFDADEVPVRRRGTPNVSSSSTSRLRDNRDGARF